MPPLLKEDPYKDATTTMQNYLYEYMFRQQDIEDLGTPEIQFAILNADQ